MFLLLLFCNNNKILQAVMNRAIQFFALIFQCTCCGLRPTTVGVLAVK